MPAKNPRIQVSLNESDAEILSIICKKKKISKSGLLRKVFESWLEDYEDMLLARRAEEAEAEWEKNGRETVSFEEVWKDLCT